MNAVKHELDKTRNSSKRGLLPSRGRDENLAVSDGSRILCTALRVDQHQLFLGAFGPEQTKIVYTFVGVLADYGGVNIRSVCTSRTEGAAGSYILLGDLSGNADELVALGKEIQSNPWLEPEGASVIPEAVVDLKIIAPARRKLLFDALSVISGEYGVNIESMMHRTYHNMFDEGFDLLRQISRGLDSKFNGVESAGQNSSRRGKGLGGRKNRGGGPECQTESQLAVDSGNDAPGEGPGNDGAGGLENGGRENGDLRNGRPENIGGEGGDRGGDQGGSGLIGDEAEFVTVTQMRLELPEKKRLEDLKADLELIGKDWELRWEQRMGHGRFDPKLTRKLFGGLN